MLYLGTSGWAYPRWKPKFYPARLPQSQFLAYYSGRLNSVEVNYTFCGRHSLSETAAERWLAQRPPEFLFAFRGPKPITHFRQYRLREADERVAEFQTTLLPFRRAGRLGPVLFRLPRTFAIDAEALEIFLQRWQRELRVSFEFRNPSWFTAEVYESLRRHGAALCLAERDELSTPEVFTSGFAYLRLRKSAYSVDALRKIAERCGAYTQRGDVFAFFRQDGDGGPFYAERVARILAAKSR